MALAEGGYPHLVQLSFAPSPNRLPSTGNLQVTALFVDFADETAGIPARAYFDKFIPQGLKIIEDVSYGRVSFTVDGPHGWFRMPKPSSAYDYHRGMTVEAHRQLIADAVEVADAQVDFSGTDAFIIVMPPTMSNPGYSVSPAFVTDELFGVRADGRLLVNGTTIGTDWSHKRDTVVAHELLHAMGLVDLYKFAAKPPQFSDIHEFVGSYSIMSNYDAPTPELLAWERWVRGWIDDDQVACVEGGTYTTLLDSVTLPSEGAKSVVVPLGETRFLAIESRTRRGPDRTSAVGVLPYVVDPAIPTGEGPIRIPPSMPGKPREALPVGAAVAVEGIGIEVLRSTGSGFETRVHVPAPNPVTPGTVGQIRIGMSFEGLIAQWRAPLQTGWTPTTGYEYRIGKGPWLRTAKTSVRVGQSKKPRVIEVRAVNIVGTGQASTATIKPR